MAGNQFYGVIGQNRGSAFAEAAQSIIEKIQQQKQQQAAQEAAQVKAALDPYKSTPDIFNARMAQLPPKMQALAQQLYGPLAAQSTPEQDAAIAAAKLKSAQSGAQTGMISAGQQLTPPAPGGVGPTQPGGYGQFQNLTDYHRAVFGADMPKDQMDATQTYSTLGDAGLTSAQQISTKQALSAQEQQQATQNDRNFNQIQLPESKAKVSAEKALANERNASAATKTGPSSKVQDAQDIANAIISGDQPPDLARLYGSASTVRGFLARNGYNLTRATEDWDSTKRYMATLNGPQQVRLRQAVDFTYDSLNIVEGLAKEWKAGSFKPLNKATLEAAKQGALGQQAQQIATKLDAQIADMQAELAVVYRGGNASTDEALKLASKNLQSDWSEGTLIANVNQLRKNLEIRRNSIKSAGVVANEGNPYAPKMGGSSGKTVTRQELKQMGATAEEAQANGYTVVD